jgi:hypothetical protein
MRSSLEKRDTEHDRCAGDQSVEWVAERRQRARFRDVRTLQGQDEQGRAVFEQLTPSVERKPELDRPRSSSCAISKSETVDTPTFRPRRNEGRPIDHRRRS